MIHSTEYVASIRDALCATLLRHARTPRELKEAQT
jgi:hypothetical protein